MCSSSENAFLFKPNLIFSDLSNLTQTYYAFSSKFKLHCTEKMSQEIIMASTSSISKIPQEILEIIVVFLDFKSALNLLQSSKALLVKLDCSLKFWKHVCQGIGIDTYEWSRTKGFKSISEWRRMFHASQNIHRVILSHHPLPVQRIVSDLSKIGQPDINSKSHQQRILQLPQDVNIRLTQNFKTLRRKLIADNIIRY